MSEPLWSDDRILKHGLSYRVMRNMRDDYEKRLAEMEGNYLEAIKNLASIGITQLDRITEFKAELAKSQTIIDMLTRQRDRWMARVTTPLLAEDRIEELEWWEKLDELDDHKLPGDELGAAP